MLTVLAVAGLSIRLSMPTDLYPAEAFPVVVRWEALTDLPGVLIPGASFDVTPMWFEIEGPGVRYQYRESPHDEVGVRAYERWPAGRVETQALILISGRGGPSRFPFAVAGEYRIRMRYDDDVHQVEGASDWVSTNVVEPEDEANRGVLRGVREGRSWGELVALYPNSRYFVLDRLRRAKQRIDAIGHGRDPNSGEAGYSSTSPQVEREAWRKVQYRGMLAPRKAEALKPGPFEVELLLRAMGLAQLAGEQQDVSALRARLDSRFPGWEERPAIEW